MSFVQYRAVITSHLVRREPSTDGTDRFVAWFPDMPGCRAQGNTDVEAVQRLYDILPRYRASLRSLGVSDEAMRTELGQASDAVRPGVFTQVPVLNTLGTSTSAFSRPPGVAA